MDLYLCGFSLLAEDHVRCNILALATTGPGHTFKYKFRENVAIHSPFLISFILFFDRETHVKMKICRRYREMLRTGRKIDDYAEN